MGNTPNYTSWINEAWGWPQEYGDSWPEISAASNIIVGTNPPYSATDLFAIYPNFGGIPATFTGTTDGTTGIIVNVSPLTGLAVGLLITGPGIPTGSVITAINGTQITISNNTTAQGTNVTITNYPTPAVPLAVINAYVFLASVSIIQARWFGMWYLAMAAYIAHYLTLWLQSQNAPPGSSGAAIAAAGLAIGIKTSKAVQDVSVGYSILDDLEGWGDFQLTIYGQQFATWAKTIGSGMMLIW